MTHWAADLIGRPWSELGEGPDDFSCWGLVRHVFREQLGIDMPIVAVAIPDESQVSAILAASQASGWRRVYETTPQPWDIVLMRGIQGRHVGVMISAGRGMRFLHSDGMLVDGRPVGAVDAPLLETAILGRCYTDIELWRRA